MKIRFFHLAATLALGAALAACTPKKPIEKKPAKAVLVEKAGFDELPGWQDGSQEGAWTALTRSCGKILSLPATAQVGSKLIQSYASDWQDACRKITDLGSLDSDHARAVIEREFTPFRISQNGKTDGLFTGYFEAELHGSLTPDETYRYPLYAKPDDLVTVDLGQFAADLKGRHLVGRVEKGKFKPYPKRGAIESGQLDGKGLELLWIDDAVDVFLLQVQGSGRVVLPDGKVVRVGFAGHNGHAYQSIGRHLIDAGELKPHQASWDGIKKWIADNPDKASALFAVNPRFIFFRKLDGDGPIGSQGVALSPERSLAVDKKFVPLGTPIWLDTVWPSQHDKALRRLMVAQDTGSAIKGAVRGDFFWGYGEPALEKAGRMKSPGRYFLLLPNPLAARMAAAS
ncbi:murein transglycosylase A [Aestuariispira ectoiniformans]|uniref:murein transglycosylase A n=1 Tax=Aestuariispira ectoiniformans TaxID=2775080 RepID=UPI00223AD380|nr:murein transglycosylase A [Aestuariispira ectoiniformans]